jgi:hypothetical protein
MVPMPGAAEAIHGIAERRDACILSASPWKNPGALQDKLDRIEKYFGAEKDGVFYKRVIILIKSKARKHYAIYNRSAGHHKNKG